MEAILMWGLVGLAAGWLASKVLGSPHGIIVDLLLGLVGALVGGYLVRALLKQTGPFTDARWERFRTASQATLVWTLESIIGHIVIAFVGALLLLALHRLLFSSRRGLGRR